MTNRKTFVLTHDDGDASITYMKPYSGNFDGSLIAVHEDAYGNIEMKICRIVDLNIDKSIEILTALGIK
jgi:hypothetical protein